MCDVGILLVTLKHQLPCFCWSYYVPTSTKQKTACTRLLRFYMLLARKFCFQFVSARIVIQLLLLQSLYITLFPFLFNIIPIPSPLLCHVSVRRAAWGSLMMLTVLHAISVINGITLNVPSLLKPNSTYIRKKTLLPGFVTNVVEKNVKNVIF